MSLDENSKEMKILKVRKYLILIWIAYMRALLKRQIRNRLLKSQLIKNERFHN